MALGPLLHVAGLSRAMLVEASSVTPFGVKLYAVRRIGDHEKRLAIAEKASHGFRVGRISAQHAMLTAGSPQRHRSPARDTGFSGSGGAVLSLSSSSLVLRKSSISRVS